MMERMRRIPDSMLYRRILLYVLHGLDDVACLVVNLSVQYVPLSKRNV